MVTVPVTIVTLGEAKMLPGHFAVSLVLGLGFGVWGLGFGV